MCARAGVLGCDHRLNWTVYGVLARVLTELSPFIALLAAHHFPQVYCMLSVYVSMMYSGGR